MAGELSSQGQSHCCLTPAQRRFAELRVLMLLMSGTLRDAIDNASFDKLVALGAHRADDATWAYGLNNLSVAPHQMSALVDALNAEVSLGTVANVNEGIQWIGYTYLFVRMKKNPIIYGVF